MLLSCNMYLSQSLGPANMSHWVLMNTIKVQQEELLALTEHKRHPSVCTKCFPSASKQIVISKRAADTSQGCKSWEPSHNCEPLKSNNESFNLSNYINRFFFFEKTQTLKHKKQQSVQRKKSTPGAQFSVKCCKYEHDLVVRRAEE